MSTGGGAVAKFFFKLGHFCINFQSQSCGLGSDIAVGGITDGEDSSRARYRNRYRKNEYRVGLKKCCQVLSATASLYFTLPGTKTPFKVAAV